MNPDKGYIHIYTGSGKGKTTASAGLAIRARSHGWRVLYNYFFKPVAQKFGEHIILSSEGIQVKYYVKCATRESPRPVRKMKREVISALQEISKKIEEEGYDLVILDEVLIALKNNIIPENILVDFLEKNRKNSELVLTGRGATPKIVKIANMVSKIKCIKHPYTNGVKARKGIEL